MKGLKDWTSSHADFSSNGIVEQRSSEPRRTMSLERFGTKNKSTSFPSVEQGIIVTLAGDFRGRSAQ